MRTARRLVPVVALSLALVACGSSSKQASTTTTAAASAASSALSIKGFAFSPATLDVKAGATVTVTNDDSTVHTWTADDGSWNEKVAPGASATHTFDKAGSYAYHCSIHPTMTGTVVVA